MGEVRLRGYLVCASHVEARIVTAHLPEHISLTRAEPGCLTFDVTPTDDPLVWRVDELFRDEDAFAAHQARVDGSSWGRATVGIERRYAVDG
jgi:quinol monooxygenase YgiN